MRVLACLVCVRVCVCVCAHVVCMRGGCARLRLCHVNVWHRYVTRVAPTVVARARRARSRSGAPPAADPPPVAAAAGDDGSGAGGGGGGDDGGGDAPPPRPRVELPPDEFCQVSDFTRCAVACTALCVPPAWLERRRLGLLVHACTSLPDRTGEFTLEVATDAGVGMSVEPLASANFASVSGAWSNAGACVRACARMCVLICT